jgi:acetolactate synthase-1/2/3 large subunit
VDFGNPDLVMYAESFGMRAHRIERADQLLPALRSSLAGNAPSLIDCPIDYRENEKLSQALGEVICQG